MMLNNKPFQWLIKNIYFSPSQVCKSAGMTLLQNVAFLGLFVGKSLCFTLLSVEFQGDSFFLFLHFEVTISLLLVCSF